MLLESVLAHLPMALKEEILRRLATPPLHGARISEIRLRRGRIASLSLFRDGRLINLPLSFVADGAALDETLAHATGGSVYAFEEQLKEGYFSLPQGVRVGASGRAVSKDGVILSLSSIDSIVFRLPGVTVSGDALFSFYRKARAVFFFSRRPAAARPHCSAPSRRARQGSDVLPSLIREKSFSLPKNRCLSTILPAIPRQRARRSPCEPSRPIFLFLTRSGLAKRRRSYHLSPSAYAPSRRCMATKQLPSCALPLCSRSCARGSFLIFGTFGKCAPHP